MSIFSQILKPLDYKLSSNSVPNQVTCLSTLLHGKNKSFIELKILEKLSVLYSLPQWRSRIKNSSTLKLTQLYSIEPSEEQTYHHDQMISMTYFMHSSEEFLAKILNKCLLFNMNLKKEISKFRSEILVGEYDSAISMAKGIMVQIQVLMTLKIIKDDRLYNFIQEEYEKCLSIKNFINNTIREANQVGVKKWGNKQTNKWKKHEQPIKIQASSMQKAKQLISQEQKRPVVDSSPQYTQFVDQIQKHIMMPIKMPSFFKHQNHFFRFITIPQKYYSNLITYFIQNNFMSVDYQAFQYQFNKNVDLNFFYQKHISEILIDCKYMPRQAIDISKHKRILIEDKNLHCIFLQISQKNDLVIE